MIRCININELNYSISEQIDLFICSSSYEDRCFSAASRLPKEKIKNTIICANRDYDEHISENLSVLVDFFADNYLIADVFTSNPIQTADNIEGLIDVLLTSYSIYNILVDITTFTHEILLILMAILSNKYPTLHVTCCYVNAVEYSNDQANQKDKWLSRGVGDVRAILGYAGTIKPSLQTHLIMIVGYEHERASKIIEILEPDSLSLGYGLASDATTEKNRGANAQYKDLVKQMYAFYDDISDFNIPCSNPYEACKSIVDEIERIGIEKNIILVPMNNKISTLGAALAYGLKNDIQLCYAPALVYNYASYSVPGNKCYIFDWSIELSIPH